MKTPAPIVPTPEQAILGAILSGVSTPQTDDAINSLLATAPAHFSDPRHGHIAAAIRELRKSSIKVTTASTCKRLNETLLLQSAGGPAYVCGPLQHAASPAQLPARLISLLPAQGESEPDSLPYPPPSPINDPKTSDEPWPEFPDDPASDHSLHARTGKIARLPATLRDQLNSRLLDGEPVEELLAWLNAVPETKAVLDQMFGAHPINKQNVSEWRRGGFQDWLVQQQAAHVFIRLSEDAAALGPISVVNFSEQLAVALASRLAIMIDRFDPRTGDLEQQTRVAHQLFRDLATLRNAAYKLQRLALQKESLALRRTESERRAEREKLKEQRLQRAEQERATRRSTRTTAGPTGTGKKGGPSGKAPAAPAPQPGITPPGTIPFTSIPHSQSSQVKPDVGLDTTPSTLEATANSR